MATHLHRFKIYIIISCIACLTTAFAVVQDKHVQKFAELFKNELAILENEAKLLKEIEKDKGTGENKMEVEKAFQKLIVSHRRAKATKEEHLLVMKGSFKTDQDKEDMTDLNKMFGEYQEEVREWSNKSKWPDSPNYDVARRINRRWKKIVDLIGFIIRENLGYEAANPDDMIDGPSPGDRQSTLRRATNVYFREIELLEKSRELRKKKLQQSWEADQPSCSQVGEDGEDCLDGVGRVCVERGPSTQDLLSGIVGKGFKALTFDSNGCIVRKSTLIEQLSAKWNEWTNRNKREAKRKSKRDKVCSSKRKRSSQK